MSFPTKKTKMSELIKYRLRITTIDNRSFVGQLLAFDNHMNLVLSDTEEIRVTKKSLIEMKKTTGAPVTEEKRSLGLVILRGEHVVSFSIESPPPTLIKDRVIAKGRGVSRPLKAPVKKVVKPRA